MSEALWPNRLVNPRETDAMMPAGVMKTEAMSSCSGRGFMTPMKDSRPAASGRSCHLYFAGAGLCTGCCSSDKHSAMPSVLHNQAAKCIQRTQGKDCQSEKHHHIEPCLQYV